MEHHEEIDQLRDESSDHSDNDSSHEQPPQKKRKIHKLSLEKTNDYNKELEKRGVLYLARVPPRMTPTKLKHLLKDFDVIRIFLQEEDPTKRKARRRMTGKDSGKRYTEGWIEFASKKVAKRVALSLNQTRMTNRKRDFFYDDLWALKYLPKFKWSHLTEKVAYERRVQEQKLRLETLQAKKETAEYKKLVETGKKLDKIAERKAKKNEPVEKKKRDAKQVRPIDDTKKATKSAILKSIL